MQIDNLPGVEPGPVDTSAPTEAQLVSDIADLLDDDPETDPVEGKEDQATAGAADDGEDPEIDVSEDVEDEAEAEDPDGSQEPEIKGGRFAPDSAKVTLEDGTVITVADLKRNNLFQRDYTKKTTELAAEREQITTRKSEVDQQAQSLTQLAERLTAFSQKYLPPHPGEPPSNPTDYVAWHDYNLAERAYMQAVNEFNGIQQGTSQLTEEQQRQQDEQANQAWASEAAALVERDKFFADPKKVQAFFDEAVTLGGDAWGLTREDIAGLRSAKAFQVLRDAVRYRKALAKAPQVEKQVQAKPVVAIGGRRADPKARVSAQKQARSERLRATGSFEDGIAAIEDLIP